MQQVTFTNKTIFRVVLVVVGSLVFLRFIEQLAHPLTLIGVSAFLAIALNPAVSWLSRYFKKGSRALATGIAYVAVLSVLAGFLALIVPPLVKQSVSFVRDVPQTVQNVRNKDGTLGRFVDRYNLDEQVDKVASQLSGKVSQVPNTLFGIVGRVGGTIVSVITVLVLTFMMLVEGPQWMEKALSLVPKDRRAHRKRLAMRMYKVITGYVNGQVLIAGIAASFALVAMLIAGAVFDVTLNALALSAIVFLLGLIPLIGNTLAAVIVVAVCLFVSFPLAVAMAIYFPVYQQIENATLAPYIQSKANQLTPLLVFIAALIGAGFGGLLGALVAIPAAGCLRIYLEDRWGKELPDAANVEA